VSTRGRHVLLGGFALAATAVVVVGAAAWLTSPDPTRIGARVRTRLDRYGGRPVRLDRVAPILREAVVATEDERFYRHDGIDVIGVLRAVPYDLVHLSFAQGASTITEQVGKILYLGGDDHNPWRKLQDAALALKLEGSYSKDQILAAYLDSAYFGEGAYGIRSASERYFGVAPANVGPAQASLLAGLIQAPSAYDPVRHPGLARARQIEVLRALVANGYLTEDEASAALHANPHLRGGARLPPVGPIDLGPGPAFVWWELALGVAVVVLGATALVLSSLARFRPGHAALAIRVGSLALALAGAVAVVKSFRTA
jgi:penicillin-binding protein 1A